MVENSNQPTNSDTDLGEQAPLPEEGIVLERLEELRQRFALPTVEQRISALSEALKYGDAFEPENSGRSSLTLGCFPRTYLV